MNLLLLGEGIEGKGQLVHSCKHPLGEAEGRIAFGTGVRSDQPTSFFATLTM